jgi:hypothetical protein
VATFGGSSYVWVPFEKSTSVDALPVRFVPLRVTNVSPHSITYPCWGVTDNVCPSATAAEKTIATMRRAFIARPALRHPSYPGA